jgi:hypothetical protein
MQEKTWYYEKWVGRHASFPPSRYVKWRVEVAKKYSKLSFLQKYYYVTFMVGTLQNS